jgi:hypothetical protein
MKTAECKIIGITGLLQNKPEQYGFDQEFIEKKAVDPEQKECLKLLYTNKEGKICQPATHIERCIAEAGKKLKVKGAGKSTCSKLFGSMISVSPDLIPHLHQEFEIHKSMVVIPSTKGRIIKYRPLLKDWALTFHIDFEEELPEAAIEQALIIAGKYIGLGDWRP